MSRHMEFLERFEWSLVKARDVRSGDLMANNATVTASRKARKVERSWGPESTAGKWFIAMGTSSATITDPDSGFVIGRRPTKEENK